MQGSRCMLRNGHMGSPPRPSVHGWRRSAAWGALVGALSGIAFLLLHAAIVEPIWRAAPLALAWGGFAGALASLLFARLQREELFAHPLGGLLLGGFAAVALAPFAVVGWMRSRDAPDPFALLILALLVTGVYHLTQAAQQQPGRWRRWELFGGLLLLNALPAGLASFIGSFHEEPPDVLPITGAIACVYVAAGAALTLARRK